MNHCNSMTGRLDRLVEERDGALMVVPRSYSLYRKGFTLEKGKMGWII